MTDLLGLLKLIQYGDINKYVNIILILLVVIFLFLIFIFITSVYTAKTLEAQQENKDNKNVYYMNIVSSIITGLWILGFVLGYYFFAKN